DDVDGVLDLLDGDGGDAEALQDLRRAFHGFAGSGATYGLAAVSRLGLDGERRCTTVGAGPAVAADLRAWRESVAALRREIAAASAKGGAAGAVPGEAGEQEPSSPERALPVVLVIEEDGRSRQGLVSALEHEAFRVQAVAPLAARAALEGGSLPDAVIVDASGGQALAFAQVAAVRARPGGDRPVVFVVGREAGALDRVEAIHCGADGHFADPVDVGALVRRLRFLLDRERAEAPRILSVEDDPHQSAYLRTVLSSAGYEFRAVEDPRRFEAELAAFR